MHIWVCLYNLCISTCMCLRRTCVFKYLTVCMSMCVCLPMRHRANDTESEQTVCVYVCVCVQLFVRPCGELALSSDVMPWPAHCGTWPPLCSVSSTLRGSTIPQPQAHNTHHSIPLTTTEQNTTTPGTMSTQYFTRKKKKKGWTKTNKILQS